MNVKNLLAILIGSALLWLTLVLGLSPVTLPTFLHRLILIIPFLGLVLFGFYSLFYLIYKVTNLKDCPQAQVELQNEIERIRRDPRYRSFFRAASTTR